MAKKYRVIAKVGNDKFVKYHVNDLVRFTQFLDEKFRGWRWFNVYEYKKDGNGMQVGSFTNRDRPKSKFIRRYGLR